ncbi:methionine biosynthesis protein MetW [Candidatus Marinamargulisbacteria bacterium SCGC AG-439-L15]|nr:methionine biosynthesis protein MetW [Candidatus Marinamargulisbacteria bacterium SCGC AG-439-L15]
MSFMKKEYYQKIMDLIPEKSRVLDLGCGNGDLLKTLISKKNCYGYGVDMDFHNIKGCIKRGISVFQGNINEGLQEFRDKSFDVVLLSQTLQEVYDPVYVLLEMLRVGKKGIVTFPNFGHWHVRMNMIFKGFSPKTKSLPYEWYNTPNIRVVTIKDFRHLCKQKKITICDEIPLSKNTLFPWKIPLSFSNLLSQQGLFVLEKR